MHLTPSNSSQINKKKLKYYIGVPKKLDKPSHFQGLPCSSLFPLLTSVFRASINRGREINLMRNHIFPWSWRSRRGWAPSLRMKRLQGQWNQGCVSWEYFRDAGQICRAGTSKAEAELELNLARGVKNNKGFYMCVSQKRRKENLPSWETKQDI